MPGLFERLFGNRNEAELEARILPLLKMIEIDGKAHPHEALVLRNAIAKLGISETRMQELIASIRAGSPVPIPTDPRHKVEVLASAAILMMSDGDTAVEELEYFLWLAAKMSISAEAANQILSHSVRAAQQLNPTVDVAGDFQAALGAVAAMMINPT